MGDRRGLRQSVPNVPMPKADVSGKPPFSQAEPLKPPPTDTAWLKTEGKCRKCGGDPEPGGEATPERGVWIVYFYDTGPIVESVHASELEALRQINEPIGRHVAFVPFGSEVREVLR